MSGGMICEPTGEGTGMGGVDASAINRDSSSARTSCSSSSFALESPWPRSEADTANARARSLSSPGLTGLGG